MINFSSLTGFDFFIIGIIVISTIFAFARGFVKSFLYFFGWIVSAILVIDFYPVTSEYLKKHVHSTLLVSIAASFGLFIILLIVITLINNKLISATKNIRGGALDMSMGFAFGFVRGCVISCIIFWSTIILLNAWDDRKEPEWLEKAQSYKLLNHGTNYLVSIVAIDTKRNELLQSLDRSKKFNISDNPNLMNEYPDTEINELQPDPEIEEILNKIESKKQENSKSEQIEQKTEEDLVLDDN